MGLKKEQMNSQKTSDLIKLIDDLEQYRVRKLKRNGAWTLLGPWRRGRRCRLECPDNTITQDVGEIVNSLDVFVPRLSWLWHDS